MAERIQLAQSPLRRTPEISTHPIRTASDQLAAALENFGRRIGNLGMQAAQMGAQANVAEGETQATAAGDEAGRSGGTAPLPKRREIGAVGRAYNKQAVESYFNGLKTVAGDEVERIYQQNQNDPAKLESSLDAYYKGVEKNLTANAPELLAPFRDFYARSARPYRQKVSEDHRRLAQSQAVADLEGFLVSKRRQDESRAFIADGSMDSVADIALARGEFLQALIQHGPAGEFEYGGVKYQADESRRNAISPQIIEKELRDYDQTIVQARYKGQFDRARKQGRGLRFAASFSHNDSILKELTLDERDSVAAWMRSQLAADEAMAGAADKTLGAAVRAAVESLNSGQAPGGLDALKAQAAGTKYEGAIRAAEANQDVMASFMTLPPGDQMEQVLAQSDAIEKLSPEALGNERYAEELSRRTDLMRAMRTGVERTRKALDDDPYAFAQAAGVVPRAEPLLDANGQINVEGMRKRAQGAKLGSEYYGQPMPPMTDDEIEDFGSRQRSLPAEKQALGLGAMIAGFGPEGARPVFERLHKKGYLVDAAAGGIALEPTMPGRIAPDGRTSAGLILEGRSVLDPPDGTKSAMVMPEAPQFMGALDSRIGGAMSKNPTGRAAASDAVKKVYAALSARAGEFNQASINEDRMDAAVEMVFGGPMIDFDGPGLGAASHVKLTPPFRGAMQEDFDGWWSGIGSADVKAGGGLSGYTDAAAAALIKERGIPVEVEQGVYQIVIDGTFDDPTFARPAANVKGKPLVLRFPVDRFLKE